jgi:hypothetical protein
VDLRILPLDKEHDRKTFHCGEPSLDDRVETHFQRKIKAFPMLSSSPPG